MSREKISKMNIDDLYSDTLAGDEYMKKMRAHALRLSAEEREWERKNRDKLRYRKVAPKTWILTRKDKDAFPRPVFNNKKPANIRSCPVIKIVNGVVIERYPSVVIAAKSEGMAPSTLSNILRGKSKPIKGITFELE